MIWSPSAHKIFSRCPRQWFYKNVMADGRVKKDPLRIEATRLSKLKTIEAWRGMVVDQVISDFIIPRLNRKMTIVKDEVISIARKIFDKQFELACLAPQNYSKIEVGLLEIENGSSISSEQIEKAWAEVESALNNFLLDEELQSELKSGDYLVPQRPLTFKVGSFSVRGFPDLILFRQNSPPIIYDWKVHFFGTISYEQQLMVYALALTRIKPHVDFERYIIGHVGEDIRLTEVQLISHNSNYKRHYYVTSSKLEEIESFISDSLLKMYLAGGYRKYSEISASDFDTTHYPENCTFCSFTKLCKKA
ncbi:PD-(D/E)XK nuclease family protein [Rhodocytophaga aerolata]|uniref:PD-(D/E)XK nuclease family protein n=1 Tax=Rhodocytophaga aerolata TaxID=455078 RepID=A0ABT8RBR3_9BACT|nr:PD-(D/E)XK nuclease family protein [Rhodocytophaga aerolata]MDO1449552.1 PD-(D/E)XK nuclease family protein [Rhodocytophaga aerolata]